MNDIFNLEMKVNENHEDTPDFEHPNGSKWIVAVDHAGDVSVIKRPFIHDCFFYNGSTAEYIGLPPDSEETPGIYEWTCSYIESHDWESGIVDDYSFEVIESKLLWEPQKDDL